MCVLEITWSILTCASLIVYHEINISVVLFFVHIIINFQKINDKIQESAMTYFPNSFILIIFRDVINATQLEF